MGNIIVVKKEILVYLSLQFTILSRTISGYVDMSDNKDPVSKHNKVFIV